MNNCRTDNPAYHQTSAFNHSDADEKADDAKRKNREEEFWSIFVHGDNLNGDKFEALKLAETIMLRDDDLYQAAIKVVADAIALSLPKTVIEKQADSSARSYMNLSLDTGSDNWSTEL